MSNQVAQLQGPTGLGLQRDRHTLTWRLYAAVWDTTKSQQIVICVLTMLLAPLATVPLELQRRIVDSAVGEKKIYLLATYGAAYLVVICIQGGLKYLLNMVKGTAIETMAREIRRKLLCKLAGGRPRSERAELNSGSIVSILAAETEDASGFAGEAIAVPLLAGGTILYVLGYLVWVQPEITVLAIAIYCPQGIVVPLTQHTINRLARLRIQLVRDLGHLAVRSFECVAPQGGAAQGLVLADRIFRIRIWIYFRKFWLAALGNFLDSVGTIIVLTFGGYLVIEGKTEVSTLVVFMSGLARIADPWDHLVNFYRSVSNTAVMYGMIQTKLQLSRSTIIGKP